MYGVGVGDKDAPVLVHGAVVLGAPEATFGKDGVELGVGRIVSNGGLEIRYGLRVGARAIEAHAEEDDGAGILFRGEERSDSSGELAPFELGQPQVERDLGLVWVQGEGLTIFSSSLIEEVLLSENVSEGGVNRRIPRLSLR